MAFSLIEGDRVFEIEATVEGGRVRVSPEVVHRTLGWSLQERGLCRGELCVPVRDRGALVRKNDIDLEELARLIGRPIALDAEERVAALGTAASERALKLASLEAPDFRLPDLQGRTHALSEHRGKKVLLIAYASW